MEDFFLEYRLTVNFPDGADRRVLLLERWLAAVVRGESVSIHLRYDGEMGPKRR